jgi:diguanylate cyclase (GGDEF)-like protein
MGRTRRNRRTRWGLLAQFGAGSLVPLLFFGVILADHERNVIRDNQESSTAEFSKLAARGLLSFIVAPSDLDGPLPEFRVKMLDTVVVRLSDRGIKPHVRISSADGTVRYSDEKSLIGTRLPTDERFRNAVLGETTAHHEKIFFSNTPNGREDVLRVDIPTSLVAPSAPAGVVQVFMPYDPIALNVAHHFKQSALLIALGLVAFWVILFPLVLSVSRRLEHQASENQFLALHDGLTQLPNRVLLRDRTERLLALSRRHGSAVAVMLLDLDRFKEVNDTLGHAHGDELLKQVGARLSHGVRDADTVARLGGDEFVILVGDLGSDSAALEVASRVASLLDAPFQFENVRLDVEASIGVAVFPSHGESFEDLLQHADIAMYAAKATHVGPAMYCEDLDVHSPERLALLGDLRTAIDNNELLLHFQPKLDLRTRAVEGLEALVRWQHPTRGLVPPDEFIPLAERTGLIHPLTAWVLSSAVAEARCWLDEGLRLPVAVNVSARSVLDPAFPAVVSEILERHGLPASLLDIEITETAMLADPARAFEVLTALAASGAQLSIDDFGVGYTSLSHLKRLPVHELKIDRSFVANMSDDENDAVIVRSTVDLGRNLGLRVVAEGVETEEVSRLLVDVGCDLAQGYLFARPMPAGDVTAWLREHVTAASTS